MSADVAYLDTSAVVKLLVREGETAALRRWLRQRPRRVASALLSVELLRAARRAGEPRLVVEARRLLSGITLVDVHGAVLDRAGELEPGQLRTLDAIHLATALSLGAELDAVVTYDRRMADAAALVGLAIAAPS
ncbi:MAG: type II toxin-antitoxin system VapC family toxin [Chloroflexi bacterium]|nr:MAG: type II toxin-antitoxin system VapC family toxin [Chloroflexota bacterium]